MPRDPRSSAPRPPGKRVNAAIYTAALDLLDGVDDPHAAVDELLWMSSQGRTAERAVAAALERAPVEVLDELVRRADLELSAGLLRVLRRARGCEADATQRRNPVARNEGFVCAQCGETVLPADNGIQRNHCPFCLYSLHVDDVPGDRQGECQGLMEPVGVDEMAGDRVVIRHRCLRCGKEGRNRAALNSSVQPDSQQALRALVSRVE